MNVNKHGNKIVRHTTQYESRFNFHRVHFEVTIGECSKHFRIVKDSHFDK